MAPASFSFDSCCSFFFCSRSACFSSFFFCRATSFCKRFCFCSSVSVFLRLGFFLSLFLLVLLLFSLRLSCFLLLPFFLFLSSFCSNSSDSSEELSLSSPLLALLQETWQPLRASLGCDVTRLLGLPTKPKMGIRRNVVRKCFDLGVVNEATNDAKASFLFFGRAVMLLLRLPVSFKEKLFSKIVASRLSSDSSSHTRYSVRS